MIRNRVPDPKKARSLVAAAIADMAFIRTIPPTLAASTTIIRSVYENFRMLGEALLTSEGKEATGLDHHTEMIDHLIGLRIVTERPLLLLNELRRIRNNINYNGYIPTKLELDSVLSFTDALWTPLLEEVKRLIKY